MNTQTTDTETTGQPRVRRTGLVTNVPLLLAGILIMNGVGTYIGSTITSKPAITALGVLFLIGALAFSAAVRSLKREGMMVVSFWTLVTGLFLGPCLQSYVQVLGWQTVVLAYVGTAAVVAVCGALGALSARSGSTVSGSKSGRLIAVLMLLPVSIGIVNMFVAHSQVINIIYGTIGMNVFAGLYVLGCFRWSKDTDD